MDLIDDLKRELEALRAQLTSSNPELYRHLALYLQVLRAGLLNAVQQACFHLATERYPQRYGELDSVQRRQLHQRLVSLVKRTSSLLTVEQLAQLAAQLERKRLQERDADRSQLLSALASASQQGSVSEGPSRSEGHDHPAGSVNLGMALPLSPEMFSSSAFPGLLPMAPHAGSLPAEHLPIDQGNSPGASTGLDLPGFDSPGFDSPGELEPPTEREALEVMQAMQAAFAEAFAPQAHSEPSQPQVGSVPTQPQVGSEPTQRHGLAGRAKASAMPPWDAPQLPTDPVNLLLWLDGFERALVRRLRNLSHAINVDLLRLGLSRSLLPVNLLDAVLKGQVETPSAPANVLALPVPLGSEALGRSLETASILLRLSDLEFEQPKLRTCRSRLQQQRQEVRRMAQQYRRLRRRLQGLEAEQLWLQDVSTVAPANPNP